MSSTILKTVIRRTAVTIQRRVDGLYVVWKGPNIEGVAGPLKDIETAGDIHSLINSRLLKESTS